MDYEQYKNLDGTYTSPNNGKIFKNLKAIISHLHCGNNGNRKREKRIFKYVPCQFCQKSTAKNRIRDHEQECYLNPKNTKICYCGTVIKNYKSSITCSYACANKQFRSGENNGNWKQDRYQSTCFLYHKKECVVCGEINIVEVHHFDENHQNNDPTNLVPLCPTHHKYWHSRYKDLVEQKIIDYVTNFVYKYQKNNPSVAQLGQSAAFGTRRISEVRILSDGPICDGD